MLPCPTLAGPSCQSGTALPVRITIPGSRVPCRNRQISPGAYARALGESDCRGYETEAFLPSPLGSRRIAGNRMLVAELRAGMRPVVRDQLGTRDVAMPDLPMVILQDLPFTKCGGTTS